MCNRSFRRFRTVLVVTAACGLVLPAVPAQAAPEPCAAGYVRLTFDDGPNRTATPDILDTLAAHGVTATFFVVGQMVAANPALVQRESRRATPSATTPGITRTSPR